MIMNVKFDNDKTSVTLLQDVLNKQGIRSVQYELLQIEGAVCAPSFQYRVTDGRFVAYGQGKSKKEAKQNAAKSLLRVISQQFPDLCAAASLDLSLLQELCTSLHLPPPVYITESEDGLPHQRLFTVSCNVSEYKQVGVGKSKKIAKRLAANKLYLMLHKMQSNVTQNTRAADNVDDFVRLESSSLSGLKNSKSSSQFHKLPEIHKHLPLGDGPCFKEIKEMTDDALCSCNAKKILENFMTEQNLKATFIDFEETSFNGQFQTSLQISTPITVAFHGESRFNYEEAQQDAAYRSLLFFKTILKNFVLKT
ncbi:RISC-loading complex subunit tarbp2-like isoform X2 [Adelges cooleyi]|uniref:RISC-loading complex subunit tarbp2-like isoform X2 n=1 Tax=Adelges cooleyi TaxID=133065 RepID=UPI00217F829C|nr:RISC-loading complex subunit tarbp2-like isoform X2 [Adelges cooleyi]